MALGTPYSEKVYKTKLIKVELMAYIAHESFLVSRTKR